MKIIGLFFMTLVFGIISMITSKKYKLQGDLKELCFPPVFSKILYGCFIISMICSVVIIYLWQDTGITILFLVMGIISAFTAWAISKYKIIIEEQELIVIYPMKKRKISTPCCTTARTCPNSRPSRTRKALKNTAETECTLHRPSITTG